MTVINVKIRRLHESAQIPAYATEGAAAFDLVAVEDTVISPGETKKVPLGFVFEIPAGYEMLIRPRSGISLNTKLRVSNSPGTVDSDYRSEVSVIIDNIKRPATIILGDDTDSLYVDTTKTNYARALSGETVVLSSEADYEVGTYIIFRGDRIAQGVIVPVPRVEFTEVAELSETARGAGGFGSSGIGTEVDAN